MNKYNYGALMNDYTFLEDIGRHSQEWGKEISRADMDKNVAPSSNARGGKYNSRKQHRPKTKRDILKLELENIDIDVDLLPLGMQRRNLNQSVYDFMRKTPLLSIEFIFHFPTQSMLTAPEETVFSIITHRNDLPNSLLQLVQKAMRDRRFKKDVVVIPTWVNELVCPSEEDPQAFTPPQFVMIAHQAAVSIQDMGGGPRYYRLDPLVPLATALKHTHFTEFPLIEVFEEFTGNVVDADGMLREAEERPAKRRRLDPKAGKKAINGLLGGYGSSGEEEQAHGPSGMSTLNDYAPSDGESEDASGEDDPDAQDGAVTTMEPAALLTLLRQIEARGGASEDEDGVDWGDSEGEE